MSHYSRREFLKIAGAGAAALSISQALQTAVAAAPSGKKPNILVIMSDEHNANVLGCYGDLIARTPNLDKLAARGVVFERNYCNSPLCVPSRLSFTAGRYVSQVSAWNNSCKLPENLPTALPRVMNNAGYDSVLCGKMHYDAQCRYGFRDVGGDMNTSHMNGRGGRKALDDIKPHVPLSARYNEFHTGDDSSIMHHDLRVTKGAVEFFNGRKQSRDKPFFMLCGYLAPHFPLIVPEKYWKHFEGKVPMPNVPEGLIESLPLNYHALRAGFGYTDVTPETVKKGRELYYGLTEWLDEQVGQVLAALQASGEADNTVIIYTADHGENMGEHGLWWKNALYDAAARVPLIVSYPARWKGGQRRTQACSLVDVVATIAELGGQPKPQEWDGDSLCAWLDDEKAPWKDQAISEYYAHNILSGYAMIRTGDWKYIYHSAIDAQHPGQSELFNLKNDPGELKNLAVNPEYAALAEQLHARLIKEIGEDPDKTEQRCRLENAKGYGPEVAGGKKGKGKGKGKGKKKRAAAAAADAANE